ncbi:MAG: hypothetical protein ABSF29_06795 [Tepidisphaeraceae bacterium]|jgi:hypothetical protein
MSDSNWLILTALAMEANAITAVCGDLLQKGGGSAAVRIIGIRANRLDKSDLAGFRGIILAGLAGGLHPDVKTGDVVISAPGEWWPGLPYRRGEICTSDHLVAHSDEKRMLFERTGALAVDMETEIVRRQCQAAGVPMATVRAISDPADQDLPNGVDRWVDEDGQLRIGTVAGAILRRPGILPGLVRLGRQSRLAAANLGAAINKILLTPSPTEAIPDR